MAAAASDGTAKGRKIPGELALRVVSASVLAILAILSDYWGGPVFLGFWFIAAALTLFEWNRIIGLSGPLLWIVSAESWAVLLIAGILTGQAGSLDPLSVGLVGLACVGAVVWGSRPRSRRLWSGVGPLYAGVVALGPLLIRNHESGGFVAVVWLFLVVWSADVGAFFSGRLIGGPKLWPAISPKKTWAGLFGGLLLGSAVPTAFLALVTGRAEIFGFGGVMTFALALVAALVSEIGDLLESAMKRHFGVKDSGRVIPGHGGVMDRLDSFVAATLFIALVVLIKSH